MPNKVKVRYTAVLEASDRTVNALEKARVYAGAPHFAKVTMLSPINPQYQLAVMNLDEPCPVNVEFQWEVEVNE